MASELSSKEPHLKEMILRSIVYDMDCMGQKTTAGRFDDPLFSDLMASSIGILFPKIYFLPGQSVGTSSAKRP